MNKTWQLQDAKARFSEVVDLAVSEGPQYVTKRGKPAVVIVSVEEFTKANRASSRKTRSLLDLIQACPAPEIFDFIEEDRKAEDYGRNVELE
ncbi:MAG: type II toxin-antitoxin system prevent-host-death family antitoxin [Planctomycetota bacterium]|nr:type II toxin-antitoxin system prevent-host-death family antitoxin [Planctomycetota bacterium]MDA1138430.1 type II toxin-antitoxin system prevent-host-death family antitoxin [Planctomycetota bacterium]